MIGEEHTLFMYSKFVKLSSSLSNSTLLKNNTRTKILFNQGRGLVHYGSHHTLTKIFLQIDVHLKLSDSDTVFKALGLEFKLQVRQCIVIRVLPFQFVNAAVPIFCSSSIIVFVSNLRHKHHIAWNKKFDLSKIIVVLDITKIVPSPGLKNHSKTTKTGSVSRY